MTLRVLLTVACLVVMPSASLAQSTFAPTAHPEDTQTRAESMLAKARQLSDIRSLGSSAFHLKATFTFSAEGSAIKSATYEEFWVSQSQWRREIAVGDVTHIEVHANSKTYVRDNPSLFPGKAKQITSAIHLFPASSAKFDFESISNREDATPPVNCLTTKLGTWQEKRAFCFEKESGLLFENVYPVFRGSSVLNRSCDYGEFEKFGADLVPREIACFEDKKKIIAVKVDELSDLASADPELFTPPAGAVESDVCTGAFHPPVAISTRDPEYSSGSRAEGGIVGVSMLVDVKGNPQNLKIVTPEKKKYDQAALSAVNTWRFKPATCDDEPVSFPIEIQIDSRIYR